MTEGLRPAIARAMEIGRYQRVGGAGLAAAVLIGVAEVADVISTWSDWHRYGVVRDAIQNVLAGEPVNLDDVSGADRLSSATGWANLIMRLAAGIVFLVWLSRARRNAEIICPAEHRRVRGWVIGAWICPVVNLWFPYQVVDDVYRASRPTNSPDLIDLRSVRGSARLGWWWALWVAGLVAAVIAFYSVRGELTVGSFQRLAVFDTISAVLTIGSAVLIIAVMREISRWQTPTT